MPISAEQWRAGVGSNNAARSHILRLSTSCFSSFMMSLLTESVLLDTRKSSSTSPNLNKTTAKITWRVCWKLLRAVFFIAVVISLLYRSGDVETNPGPTLFDLTPANLFELQALTYDARPKWFNLGLALGINSTKLKTIEIDHREVDPCFREMLSTWLTMSGPQRSWQRLFTALRQPTVGFKDLVESIEDKFGIAVESESSSVGTVGTSAICNTETVQERIQRKIRELEKEFGKIVDRAHDIVSEKQISVHHFIARLANLPMERHEVNREFIERIIKITKDTTTESVWLQLTTYWNFLNYFLLDQVVYKFGDDSLETEMEDYKKKLQDFRCRTRLCDFAKYSARVSNTLSEKNLNLLAIKLDQHWDDCTLEDLENLADKLTHKFFLPSFALKLKEIILGSIHITWAIPTVIGALLKDNMENTDFSGFSKEYGITSITVDGKEYKYSPTKVYSTYLKDLYSNKEGKNLAPFKLARIEKKKVMDRKKCDDFTRSTLRGDKDDVVYIKKHVDEDEIGIPTYWTDEKQPRLILIEGGPGVGKTTFSEQFCYKWSQGQLLNNHRLLVLLPLRDNRMRSARNVKDLFQHPQLQQDIAEEVESSGGEGVALWLEAWDELGEKMRNKPSIFLDLVHGYILPKATVIMTSRPWATKNMRENTSIKLDQHIEIVSTPKHQLSRVLREYIIRPDSRAKFIEYIRSNPSIKAATYAPVTADIVTEVFHWSIDTESTPPATMTQLYTSFTCKLLMQHFSGHKEEGTKGTKIRSLDEVPADWNGELLEKCRLAWEGIVQQQFTFCNNNICGDTLGLMHGVRELYGDQDGQCSYHFIHLTLQEFLSAYHITQLPLDKQDQVIRDHIKTEHMNMVVRFYFGLTKPNLFTTRLISEQLTDQKQPAAYHWLFEAGKVKLLAEESGSKRSVVVRTSYSWTPLDYYVLGYCVSHYQFEWELYCGGTSMGDDEGEMLRKGMTSSAEMTWNGKIDGYFNHNNISLDGIKWFVNLPLQFAQQIRTLSFDGNKLDRNALNAFCEVIPKLTKLQFFNIRYNPLGNGGAVEMLKCFYHCGTPLMELNLACTDIGEEDYAQLALLIANTELEKFGVSGDVLFSEVVMASLIQNSTIQDLNISHSCISDENCSSLIPLLQQASCRWKKLDIMWCSISGEGAMHLAKALSNNHSLRELYLSCNQIGDTGAAALGDMLRSNVTLRALHVDSCGIHSDGSVHLAAGLSKNNTLETLCIGGNQLGVDGAKALSEMIEENETLKRLDLDYDDSLKEEGVDSLIAGLEKNVTLQKVTLPRQYRRPAADPRVWEE